MKNKYLANEILNDFKKRLQLESDMKIYEFYEHPRLLEFCFNINLNNGRKMHFTITEINKVGAYEVMIDYKRKYIYLDKYIFLGLVLNKEEKI